MLASRQKKNRNSNQSKQALFRTSWANTEMFAPCGKAAKNQVAVKSSSRSRPLSHKSSCGTSRQINSLKCPLKMFLRHFAVNELSSGHITKAS